MNTTADQKLSFQCTACGKKLSVAPSARGKVVACPCGQKLKIPSLPEPAPASIFDSDLPEAISPTPQATNAYASPAAAPARHAKSSGSSDVNTVKSGQKLLIYSILGSLCSLPIISLANLLLGGTPEKPELTLGFALVLCFGILAMLAAAVCASLSIFRMGRVLFPGSTRYIYAMGVLIPIPLLNLLIMFVSNSKATRYLKAQGIHVGFWGATG